MLRANVVLLKNPVVPKFGKGAFTHQFKRILQKKPLHFYRWTPLTTYDPRPLWHTDRRVDHKTGQEKIDARWNDDAYIVPDQTYGKIPVPSVYKDAYWIRDAEARRIQCPVEWVIAKYQTPQMRARTDFQDLAFAEKQFFSDKEVLEYAARQRR